MVNYLIKQGKSQSRTIGLPHSNVGFVSVMGYYRNTKHVGGFMKYIHIINCILHMYISFLYLGKYIILLNKLVPFFVCVCVMHG